MASNIVCPYCFESYSSSKVHYICMKCDVTEDAKLREFWKVERRLKPRFVSSKGVYGFLSGKPREANCPTCKAPTYRFACPHCHNELVPEMVENGSVIVSIIGAPSSGKTNYITVLINELKKNAHKVNLGFSPTSVGRDSKEYTSNLYNNEYYKRLYVDKQCAEKTKENEDKPSIPLIFRLNVRNTKKAVYLVFYDSAGENFNDPDKMEAQARFLSRSAGIVLLFDSYSVPKIDEMLKERRIQTNRKESDGTFRQSWEKIYDFMNRGKDKALFKKPFAITFSKIDTLIENKDYFHDLNLDSMDADVVPSYLRGRDGEGFSLRECDNIHESFRSALSQWDSALLNELEDRSNFGPDGYRLFGISALGTMPNPDLSIPELKPFRVMDPLLWVLYKLGFEITIKKE